MPSCRRLLASIHDVSPRFEGEVEQLLDLVRPHVGNRLALLVVPNHWRQSPIAPGSAFATRLRGWAEAGFEIFLHGMYHEDEARHDRQSDRLRAQWMTAGEGEFLGLPKREAADRIQSGQSLLEDITGQPIAGFIAPAWLYGPGAIEALAESGLSIAEDHMKVWRPATGEVVAKGPVITWASRSRGRIASSLAVAAVARAALPRRPWMRLAVHPGDTNVPALTDSIARTVASLSRGARFARYSELLPAMGA